MADDYGEKSLPPTPERRRRMRAAGHVAHSADLSSAGVLLGGLLALVITGGALVDVLAGLITAQLSGESWLTTIGDGATPEALSAAWTPITLSLGKALMPLLAVILLVGVGLHLAQTGWLFLPSRVLPDASRINPGTGLARLVSTTGTARLGFGLVKLATIGGVALWSLHQRRIEIVNAAGLDLVAVAWLCWQLCLATTAKVAVAMGVLAVADYGVRRWRYERDLMMTPQELREEMRNEQGYPAVAARRRGLQQQALPEPLDVAVPKAQLVVTGADHAVALRYDPTSMVAPAVIARGSGAVAGRLRTLAASRHIPVADDPILARSLYRETPLRGPLPASLWSEVARAMAASRVTTS